jgi:hypothetical protein
MNTVLKMSNAVLKAPVFLHPYILKAKAHFSVIILASYILASSCEWQQCVITAVFTFAETNPLESSTA